MKLNNRMTHIKEYHFKKIDDLKSKMIADGKKIYDLGIGDPDLPVRKEILNGLVQAFNYSNYNRYPPYDGINELKKHIIEYYKNIYSLKLQMDEVIILIGSKEGICHLIPAVCDVGDLAIVPDPAYPVYQTCARLWGVQTYKVPLTEANSYLPVCETIPQKLVNECKLLTINYPNNPTGATADEEFYKYIVEFCIKNDIVLCNDGAYNEIVDTGCKPRSLLQFDSKRCFIEFGTFSKLFNMTGFRLGYAVGNREIIKRLLNIKSNMDSGQFIPIQYSGIEALKLGIDYADSIRETYTSRKKAAEALLDKHNIKYYKSSGAFYIWCSVPDNYTTDEFCEELIINYGIIVTPGYSFGSLGHNHFRIALTQDVSVIEEALSLIKNF